MGRFGKKSSSKKGKELPKNELPKPKIKDDEALKRFEQTQGWFEKAKIDSFGDYNTKQPIDKVIEDARRSHREGALSGVWDSFTRPMAKGYRNYRRIRKGQGSQKQGIKGFTGSIHGTELGEVLRETVLGDKPVDDGQPKTIKGKCWRVSNQILTSTVATTGAKQVLKKAEKIDNNTPFGVIVNALAVPYRLQQERKAVHLIDNAYDAYYEYLNALSIDDVGMLSYGYYDPLFMNKVYPKALPSNNDLATAKSALLMCTNKYFQGLKVADSKVGSWLGGLTGSGAAFGIGVGIAAAAGVAVLTGGLAVAAAVAAGVVGWLAKKVTKKIYQAIRNKASTKTQGKLASSYSMAGDYTNHFFYQCPICYSLFISPINEDLNDTSCYPHQIKDEETVCPTCNAFYMYLEMMREEASKKGKKTRWAYNEMKRLFSHPKAMRKLTFFELSSYGVPVLMGATAKVAGGFEPGMFLDTILRYKLCFQFPDAKGYGLTPRAVRGGGLNRRGQLFQHYSPYAIQFMSGWDDYDIYEAMRRIIQYIAFPLPTELAVEVPEWGGSYMTKTSSSYSTAVRKYWNRDLFKAGVEIAGIRTTRFPTEGKKWHALANEAMDELGKTEVVLLTLEEFLELSAAKGKGRKKITLVDTVLERYWKEADITKEQVRTKTTGKGPKESIIAIHALYIRRIKTARALKGNIKRWLDERAPANKNPRYDGVRQLLASNRRELARLKHQLYNSVEPVMVAAGALEKQPERRKDTPRKAPSKPEPRTLSRTKGVRGGLIKKKAKPLTVEQILALADEARKAMIKGIQGRKLSAKSWKEASAIKRKKRGKEVKVVDSALVDFLSLHRVDEDLKTPIKGDRKNVGFQLDISVALTDLDDNCQSRLKALTALFKAIGAWKTAKIPYHTNDRWPAMRDLLRTLEEDEEAPLLALVEALGAVRRGDDEEFEKEEGQLFTSKQWKLSGPPKKNRLI